ncbi:hypothetical protein PHMEG_0002429 [Phytophthora megakarya]|uniref:Jacalin-type lectin domain-containing protein n=1 Tax=Phytophthora megakarya TaxID=4795 RepID=A0A225X0Q7_9STRA|nr:hypothetical protein PHMEG_0002429 [Phytophthora megakarya]
MEAHWGDKKGRTRISYLSFVTSAGNTVSGGSQTKSKSTVTAPQGFQLGGFFGQDGDEIDKLGAIWTRISGEATPTPAVPSSGSVASIESLAGSTEEQTAVSGSEADFTSMSSGSEALNKKSPAKRKSTVAVSLKASEAISTAGSSDAFGSAKTPKRAIDKKKTDSATSDKNSAATYLNGSGSEPTKQETTSKSTRTSISDSAIGSASTDSTADSRSSAAVSTDGSQVTATIAIQSASGLASIDGSQVSATIESPPVGTETPAGQTMTVKDSIVMSESFGGPHGMDFSDKNFVNSGQVVSQISIHAGKRLDGITMMISSPKTLTFTHGGTGGDQKVLKLVKGEYINSMEIHWGKKDSRTRIFYINFQTSAGNSLSGGTMTSDKRTLTAPEGFQLAGFYGKSGKELDTLGAIWAYIELVTPAPTPVPAPTIDTEVASPGTGVPTDIAGSLSEVETKADKRPVQLSESIGGPHGLQFSDQLAATSGMIISSVTIRAGERVDGLTLQVTSPKEMTFTHGGAGGKENTLTLEPGEYITSLEAYVGKKNGKTRIYYLRLGTSGGNQVSGGTQTEEKYIQVAPKGYQLGGFFGRYGDEIDLIGAVWSRIQAVNETTTLVVSADEDIALGELFGGPHGNAFSDINDIKFGRKIGSITLRSDKRVDAVTLQYTAPIEQTLNHGGDGGTEKKITLAANEYITTMEAHWDKNDKHTRVFYVSFTTNTGQTISGGTQTDKKGTATAPEGFMLSGFYGRAGEEVDQLGAIWTRMTAQNILLTDPSGVGNGTYGTTIRNWVGPTIGKSTDTACYRKTIDYDSNNICPLGYGKDGGDCIAQCPMSYPVSCGLECLPQNDNCALAIFQKIISVVAVAVNLATGGVFGEILAMYKIARWSVMCVANIINVIKGLIYYLRYRQRNAPEGTAEELLVMAYQADVVLFDLPMAICGCLGLPIPGNARFADAVLTIVEGIVKQTITNGDQIISSGANVMKLLTGNEIINKTSTTVDELQTIIDKNSSCGWQLKRLADRITLAVYKYRNVSDKVDDIRVKVYKSAVVLNDIPIVTNNCMGEILTTKTLTAAYETRDLLRKTFGVIVDQLIETGKTDMGKDVAEKDYMLEVANMGLIVLSTVDPTGIAYMASQFVQPICGPTAYLGEIDDGTLHDALGLTSVDEAFRGSYGSYTHAGDGVVRLIFESVDTKDVTVVIHTGGTEYAEVDVGAGDTVTWESTIPELQDKNMYLDRWRPGLLGLPGSGGGSLLLWIPRSSEGGHITMHVRINPS